ncbi:hypothetical protein [Rathayibacter sp. VKM Ac-2801]|uniref:hypothetical protein n=1 Tax=Rathayibacter sp. VKM Ac-2801 TaxID=2609255 RepID=UPI00131F5C31|nr:hypothetical protein [Rathayibacter sp. VKM Ac-2801]QHC69695.1 hypothetical protein GSU45_04415 [Rathayibacter sp. VKM Ac-2801]
MSISRAWRAAAAVASIASLSACATEYHGHDSGIDGRLWRQMAAVEDPLSASVHESLDETIGILHGLDPEAHPPPLEDPTTYLSGIAVPRWNGEAESVDPSIFADGGVVLYDEDVTDGEARFSLFLASGPIPGEADDGGWFSGPSEVYTCYGLVVDFRAETPPGPERTAFEDCPAELVSVLRSDAAFASAEVFDG